MLRMTPAWIYAQTRKGALPHVRLGRYVRYRRSAITEWLAAIETGDGALTHARGRR
jgi:excisionase family DNA binding protein